VLPLAVLPNAVIVPPLYQRNPPPCAAFCAAIMPTVPPLLNATLFPLKDKIWIWQNEFYLQTK
jgi:hypothetical protein